MTCVFFYLGLALFLGLGLALVYVCKNDLILRRQPTIVCVKYM